MVVGDICMICHAMQVVDADEVKIDCVVWCPRTTLHNTKTLPVVALAALPSIEDR